MSTAFTQTLNPAIMADELADPFVTWLRFANAGMLTGGNLNGFNHAISNLPSAAPIVEIGSFCGLSTNLLTYYKRKHGKTNPLFTCDKWFFEGAPPDGTVGATNITHREYRDFVKDSFIRNVQMFSRGDLPHTIEAFSDEFFDAWKSNQDSLDVFHRPVRLGGPISFCFIDGNHSYDFARRDFEHCDEFLESGGFILFDDSADGSAWEVVRVVDEVKRSGRYDVIMNNPNYLVRKR